MVVFIQKVAILSDSICPASQHSMASRYGWPVTADQCLGCAKCDRTEGHNVTCDNFFTCYELSQQLL